MRYRLLNLQLREQVKGACITWMAVALSIACATGARAQENFPNRPVRLVNPYTPGGSVDLVSRGIAVGLSEMWKQQVIVDNRPGAGTAIGTELVARAEPDGYTMLCNSSAIAIMPALYRTGTLQKNTKLTLPQKQNLSW